jgi:OFA family oxalate/formate antiporter-like MFS transporter
MCFVSGLIGSAIAIYFKSLLLLYLFYGCIGGIGLGVGYIAPVATLLKWFPERRGFAGGCAVMSFGFSAMIAGPVMQHLVHSYGIIINLLIMAIIYTVIMCISIRLIEPPPKDIYIDYIKHPSEIKDATTSEAMHTASFWMLWTVFFINISCGIALLSIASPMAQNIGMNAVEAAGMVGMIGLLNGGGRIFFASVSDYIGRGLTYSLFFAIEIIAFYMLTYVDNAYLFQSIVFVIVSCYGGGFSCMPAYLSDIFGTKCLSAIHGRILTAWGLAGIAGPLIITRCYEVYGNYIMALNLFSILFFISLIISIILIKKRK